MSNVIQNLMVDYRDFMLQAQKDIKRTRWLYEKNDFGFAAYSAEQGIEKYLKAYLMKINIIRNPDKLGHLTYPRLLAEIITELQDQKFDSRNDETTNKFLGAFIKFFENYSDIFIGFEKSIPKKILCWKESLKIDLNDEEKKIVKGLEVELNNIKNNFLTAIMECIQSISKTKPTTPKLDPLGVSKLIALLQRCLQAAASNSSFNLEKELNELQVITTPALYGMKENSFSRKDSDFFLKYFGLVKTFQWIDPVVAAYPHEEIGRYPFDIDGTTSTEIYKERKDDLSNLINALELACNQIKIAIING